MPNETQPRLRKFSPRLEALVQASPACPPIVLWTTDTHLRVTSLQGSGLPLLDLKPAELEGVDLTEHFERQDSDQRILAAHRRAVEGEATTLQVTWGEGAFELHLEPMRDATGNITGVIGIGRERSARKPPAPGTSISESRLRALIEHSTDMKALVDAQGRILYASPSTTRILGYAVEDYVGRNAFELIHPEDCERVRGLLLELLEKPGGIIPSQFRIRAQDGEWRDVESSGHNLLAEPDIQAIVVNYRDITERRRTEEALRQAEEKYRSIVENAVEGIFQTTPEGGYISVNPALARMYGYVTPGELMNAVTDIGRQVYVDPQHRVEFRRLIEEKGVVEGFEYQVYDRHGKKIWLTESARAVRDANGKILYYEGTVEDITARKRAEAERQVIFEIIHGVTATPNLDELLRLIHQALKKVVYGENCRVGLFDQSTGLFYYAYYVDQFDQVPPPQKPGKSCAAYVLRTGRPMLFTKEVFDRLSAAGEVARSGTPARAWAGVPLRTHSGVMGVLVLQNYGDERAYTDRDMEFLASVGSQIALAIQRKRADETLRLSEASFRLLFENNPLPTWVFDLETLRFMQVNDAAVQNYGYSREEFLGMQITDIRPPEDVADLTEFLKSDPFEGKTPGQWRHRLKDGAIIEVEITSHKLEFAGREAALVVAQDITERRVLERQLRQAQKMEAVGRLAGGVAHDFNNLLMVIKGHTELLLERARADDWHYRKVEQIQKAADRAAGLTRQLLAFSRMQMMQPKVIDINAVVTEMGKMLPRLIGEDIQLSILTDARLGTVKADPNQMEQVVLNLAVNARDAMPDGGKLVIETSNVNLDEAYVRLHPPLEAGNYVMLAVTDTGVGMDAETQAHIFEPFFTTKEKGRGTGLGLATVYGVVKQTGGYIWVYSEPGRGSTFKIYLPRVEELLEAQRPAKAPGDAPQGSETILLAEDERDVREVAREFLTLSGYTVLEAKDGAEAIEVAQRHPGPIHLLVTDMVMPGMGGRELALRLAPVRPDMRVIYMSGYTEYATVRQGELQNDEVLLTKPFTRSILARTVREVLHGGPVQ